MLNVRVLFDANISQYPSMKHYLSPDSNIVHSPCFEHANINLDGLEITSEDINSKHALR